MIVELLASDTSPKIQGA